MNIRTKNGEEGYVIDQDNFITVIHNSEINRAEVEIRGAFPTPENLGGAVLALRRLSTMCSTLLFTINSPGGCSNTLVELLNVSKLFENVITINAGNCASAGFLLWCSGDIRVVSQYATFMAHRESYGLHTQTGNHLEYATHTEGMFARMFADLCTDVLTDDEFRRINGGNVYLSDKEVLDRGAGITLDEFLAMDERLYTPVGDIFSVDGGVFFRDNDGAVVQVEMEFVGSTTTDFGFRYGLTDIIMDVQPEEMVIEPPVKKVAKSGSKKKNLLLG